MNPLHSAGRPRAIGMFLLIVLLLVVAACSAPAAATPSPTERPTPSPTVAPTLEPTPSPTPQPGIGTKIKVGNEQYVTATAVDPWEGTDTQRPSADKVFVAVKIRIDGITTTSFTSADFSVKDVAGNSYVEQPPGAAPHLSYQNGLEPDHYYEGYVTFQVPAAAADQLVLVYTPNFLTTTYEIKLY
jgi:hypothetical protein